MNKRLPFTFSIIDQVIQSHRDLSLQYAEALREHSVEFRKDDDSFQIALIEATTYF